MDATINLGHTLQILQILVIVGTIAGLWIRMEKRLTIQEEFVRTTTTSLKEIDEELKKLAEITVQIARQDERMTAQDARLNNIAIRLDEHVAKRQAPQRKRG